MARPMSPKRLKALKIWLNSGREKQPKEIAEELGVSSGLVRKWKSVDKWEEIPDIPNKRGAPYRNKNAAGNKGGGAPLGNENAVKHGLFRKWLPDDEEYQEIYEAAREGMTMLDILYEEILMSFTNIVRAQKIMFVQDKEDLSKYLKKNKEMYDNVKVGKGEDASVETRLSYTEQEYEIHTAADKHAKALTSQAAAMRTLTGKIKQYEEMIRSMPPDQVKEEHRLRIEKMKVDIKAIESKAW